MFFIKKIKKLKKPTVLIAPLDWGLGHATRCIPIIQQLNNLGATVIIAAIGPVKNLLQQEFPENQFISIPPYNIKYARSSKLLVWRLILQIPRVFTIILRENWLLKRIVRENSIDIVISDNRFGLFHPGIHTVYITHQLKFATGNHLINKLASYFHHWFIKKYSRCWIPDFRDQPLAGILSRSYKELPVLQYIGCLSRFEKLHQAQKKYEILVLISGPEPQRSLFESSLLNQLANYDGKVLIIRGLPGNQALLKNKPWHKQNIVFKNHVNGQELAVLIQQSRVVICRSGYTSVMDLIKIQQKAILIPTPGQPEQEYLAKHLLSQGILYAVQEKSFVLENELIKAGKFSYIFPDKDMNEYVRVIKALLDDFQIKQQIN